MPDRAACRARLPCVGIVPDKRGRRSPAPGAALRASGAAQHGTTPGTAYSTNYLVDVHAGVIVDVEATSAHRTEETEATKIMIERVEERLGIKPSHLIGDTAYGTAPILGWLVNDRQIEPHIPVWDKSQRDDGKFSNSAFTWNEAADEYRCPQGRALRRGWRAFSTPRTHMTNADTVIYRSRSADCASCPLKAGCCPNAPFRKIARSVNERARNVARARCQRPLDTANLAGIERRSRCCLPT